MGPLPESAREGEDGDDASQLGQAAVPARGPTGESVGRQAARGVLWMTAQKWVSRAGGLITTAILARLLMPEDFGLVAIAWTVVTLTYVLSDMGLATYIIQAEKIGRQTLSTAFWVSLIVGFSLGGLVLALAPVLASALKTPAAMPILQVMAGLIVIIAASSVPLALLRRRMAFRRLAMQEVVGAMIAQVVAIAAAFGGLGVWALVLQLLVAQLIASTLVWIAARWHPSLEFSRTEFSVMAGFGMRVVANGLVAISRAWAETGIIAAGLGVRELGYFTIAQRLVQTASDLSGSALFPVSTVAFARTNSSPDRLRAAHARATSVSQAVVTPLMVGIAVSAGLLVPFLFGSEWSLSALVAQPLAIAATLAFGVSIDHGLHNGVGKPGRWVWFSAAILAVSVAAMLVAVPHGAVAVALAFVITAILETIGRWVMVARLLDQSVVRTAIPSLSVAPSAVVSALAGFGMLVALGSAPVLVTLASTAVAVVGVHVAMTRIVTPAVWTDLISLLPRRGREVTG